MALKALGNGWVPLQAVSAWEELTHGEETEVQAG